MQPFPLHRRQLTRRALTVGVTSLALAAGFAGGRSTVSAAGQRPPVHASTALPEARSASYSQIVESVAPAVVTIRVEQRVAAPAALPDSLRDFFRPEPRADNGGRRAAGLGSGVVIGADGLILTNHHVIDGADRIRVELADGRSFPATVAGSDAASDLAVLRVEARGLPTLRFGDSDQVRVGDLVLAFGNPLGIGPTVTMGIVSAKGRATGLGTGAYEDFLQTDAPINQGNSGGALVNMRGELVGINAQIVSPSGGNIGLGFAIPSTMAHAVADQLTRDGVVHRSKLGVTVQAVTPELAESLGLREVRGALVSGIESGGPAEHAGLRQGDVITGIDGRSVADANALRNQISSMRPQASVSLTLWRGGRIESLSARLIEVERSSRTTGRDAEEERGPASFGMALTPLTPRIAEQLELSPAVSGMVVTAVDPAGVAGSAGIQAGDVITRVNDREVTSMATLRAALATRADRPTLVLLNRQGSGLFLALPQAGS